MNYSKGGHSSALVAHWCALVHEGHNQPLHHQNTWLCWMRAAGVLCWERVAEMWSRGILERGEGRPVGGLVEGNVMGLGGLGRILTLTSPALH